ncbi:DUF6691 family protein [Ovoidimarina sediminis]|uniref:DUF6691 family protein n=1 Tax=Ovoidimarina sediminis TaxID=3079856 RepID=UPI00290CED1D|nr:DUF6691 family protein [Rhodophyticola sp. MJ-SS7]MDU8946563.1 DUF6691 family protein [Rhodophyticola sp. MJ-SS7]
MRGLSAFLCGGLFGAGLYLSGMTDTTKVQGWLDIFGAWDPTLAFVLGGAILPMALAWAATRGRQPVLGGSFPARPDPAITPHLAIGSALFGAGWALVGLCPGPALASLSYGGWPGLLFAAAMALGMWLAPHVTTRRASPA